MTIRQEIVPEGINGTPDLSDPSKYLVHDDEGLAWRSREGQVCCEVKVSENSILLSAFLLNRGNHMQRIVHVGKGWTPPSEPKPRWTATSGAKVNGAVEILTGEYEFACDQWTYDDFIESVGTEVCPFASRLIRVTRRKPTAKEAKRYQPEAPCTSEN